MRIMRKLYVLSVLLVPLLLLFPGCKGDVTNIYPPPPPDVIKQTGEFQFYLDAWYEPDRFVIQGTSYIGEPAKEGSMLTLPEKFKSELFKGQNTPSYIVKLLESELYNEQTLQADWEANSGESNVDYTPTPPAAGEVILSLAAIVPDQENLTGNTWVDLIAPAYKHTWQSFQHTEIGPRILDKINLYFYNSYGVSKNAYVELWSASKATKISSTIIVSVPPTAGAWYTAYFSGDNLLLQPSTEYWIKIYGGPYTISIRYQNTNVYASGQYDQYTTGSWYYNLGDLMFEVQFKPIYLTPGYIQTKVMDVGSVPVVFGLWKFQNLVPSGVSVAYQGWAHDAMPGTAWTLVQQLDSETQARSLANLGSGIVIAGTAGGGKIYRSTDNGASWTLIQQLGTETDVLSFANLGSGIVIAGTAGGGKIYRSTDSGASWSLIQQLGSATHILSLAVLDGCKIIAGTGTLTGQIYHGGNPVALGTVVDGQAITVRSQYYAVKATLTADTAQATSPTLRSIMARFPTYRGYSDNPRLGYEAALQSASALTTKIGDFEPSSITQVTFNLALTKSVSDYLKTKYPKNKEARLLAGFMVPEFTEADYYEYYRGIIDEWDIGEKDIVPIKVKDFSRQWDVPVPVKWQSSGDNKTWTAMHPVDVMLDIFQGSIGSTDAEIDISSFNDVKLATPGWVVTRTITGNTIPAKDLLEELRKLLSAYFIPQPNGRIKLKRFSAGESAAGSLSDRNFITKKWEGNAASLINQLNIYFNWDGSGDNLSDFMAWDLFQDATSKANWNETITEEIKDKWTASAQSAQVEARRTIILGRYANPPEKLIVTVDMRFMEFETGDIIAITTLRAPSSDMSGITAKPFQIIQKTPDFTKDHLSLTLLRQGSS